MTVALKNLMHFPLAESSMPIQKELLVAINSSILGLSLSGLWQLKAVDNNCGYAICFCCLCLLSCNWDQFIAKGGWLAGCLFNLTIHLHGL
jgi:hypothetical protein